MMAFAAYFVMALFGVISIAAFVTLISTRKKS